MELCNKSIRFRPKLKKSSIKEIHKIVVVVVTLRTMCSGLFLEKIFFVGLFKLSGKLPSPDQNDTYVPPSFSSSCKLSKILFQFVEKKLQFQTILGIMCCIKQSVYDCFKDINFWSAARLAEIYNGGTGVSASRRPSL